MNPVKVKGVLDLPILFLWGMGAAFGARAGLFSMLGLALGGLAAGVATPLFGAEMGRLLEAFWDAEGVFPPEVFSVVGCFLVWSLTFSAFGFFGLAVSAVLAKLPLGKGANALGGAVVGFFLAVFLTLQAGVLLGRYASDLVEQSYLLGFGRGLWEIVAPWWEWLRTLAGELF